MVGHWDYTDWYDSLDFHGKNATVEVEYIRELLNGFDQKVVGIIFKWLTRRVSKAHIIIYS